MNLGSAVQVGDSTGIGAFVNNGLLNVNTGGTPLFSGSFDPGVVTNAGTTVYGARIDTSIAPAEGDINSFEALSGQPALTKVTAPSHGLNTGEEIVISGTAVDAANIPSVKRV